MPLTVLRSAINRPVRYSAKCRRSGSLANKSAYWVMRSCTTVGNSTIAGIPAPGGDSVGTDRLDYRTTEARVVQLCKTTVREHPMESIIRDPIWQFMGVALSTILGLLALRRQS